MLEEEVITHLECADSIGGSRHAAMKTSRKTIFLTSLPNRMEKRMIEELVLNVAGKVNADDPRFACDFADQGGRALRITHRHHGHSTQSVRIYRAIVS